MKMLCVLLLLVGIVAVCTQKSTETDNEKHWLDTLLYAPEKQELSMLQYEIMKLQSSSLRNNSSAAAA